MNYLDIILIIPIAYGLVLGLRKGLIKEVAGLFSVIIGIYLSRYLSLPISDLLIEHIGLESNVSIPLSYALVFIVITLGIAVLAHMLSKIIGTIRLGWLNRFLGAIFGMLKVLLLLSVILNFVAIINKFAPFKDSSIVKQSLLYVPIEQAMDKVLPLLNFEDYIDIVREEIVEPVTNVIEGL